MKIKKPINRGIVAKRHTPQYRMHKYFARRPYNVFSNLIKHYSDKDDIILDCFCGGGVTVFESVSLNRKVIGVDLNPLATFITRKQMYNGDLDYLSNIYTEFIKSTQEKYKKWYLIKFDDDEGIIDWLEWAYIVQCPFCNKDIKLTEENKIKNGIYKCSNTNCEGTNGIKRIDAKPNSSVPIRVRYKSNISYEYITRNIDTKTMSFNFNELIELAKNLKIKPNFTFPMDWDRQHEDKLKERGILEYKDLFTMRNYALNSLIFNDILLLKNFLDKDIYEMIYFLFSSSLRYTNNMTRVTDNWEGGNPTSMDKHAYWLPNQYIETNILNVLHKRSKNILSGIKYNISVLPDTCSEVASFEELKNKGSYLVLNRSSSNLPIPNESIDVIITDPPYGSNVQYAELSSIWNTWYQNFIGSDNYIYKVEEAIVNRKTKVIGAKSELDYEELLFNVFSECNRVLKNGKYLVFTFNNKNIKVWIAMMKAVARAGFYLSDDGVVFQDSVESYKNTSHLRYAGNIHGDFIYSFLKGNNPKISYSNHETLQQLIESTIENQITELYKNQNKYSTTELYQKIFSKLVSILMMYISKHYNNNNDMLNIEKYSSSFLETFLKRKLEFNNGYWLEKEGKL